MITASDPGPEMVDATRSGLKRWLGYFSVGLISRVVVVLLGCAFADRSDRPTRQAAAQQGRGIALRQAILARSSRLIEPWYRWDAVWYAEISQDGYQYQPGVMSNVAFLPGLPIVMATGARLGLDRYWVGLLVPNIAFAAGLAWFALATIRLTGDPATARRSCLLLIAYPWSFFFSAPYQESLGLCLSGCALWAWLSYRPGTTMLASALATSARISSVAMGAGVMAEWFWAWVRRRPRRPWAWAVALASLVGVGLFYAYLYRQFGDPRVSLKSHEAWGRKPASLVNFWVSARSAAKVLVSGSRRKPLLMAGLLVWICHRPILRAITLISKPAARLATRVAPFALVVGVALVVWFGIKEKRHLLLTPNFIPYCDILTASCFLALGLRAWIRRGPLWACLTLIPIALALATGSFLSMNRVVLAAFPAFIEASEIFKDRLSMAMILVLMVLMQLVLINNYVNWFFLRLTPLLVDIK